MVYGAELHLLRELEEPKVRPGVPDLQAAKYTSIYIIIYIHIYMKIETQKARQRTSIAFI